MSAAMPSPGSASAALVARHTRHFGQGRMQALTASGRVLVERDAAGSHIHDIDGRRFLDFFVASGVFNVGHRNPAVGAALEAALGHSEFGGVFYLSEDKAALAERLATSSPAGLEVVLPAIGGGEAIDLALKLAMAHTGRCGVICGEASYHGSTGLSAELGPQRLREWYPLAPLAVRRVPVGDLDALAAALDEEVAACVFEPLRSLVDGRRPGRAYWRDARHLLDANGTLLVIDEVVCGMGRLGHLWGSALDDIRPDLLVAAKGLSGGYYPMAAVVCRPELLQSWGEVAWRAYSTYAWSNLGARVALAAIDEVERLLPAARARAAAFERALLDLAAAHPAVLTAVRRSGLHFVLEFDGHVLNGARFTDAMFERGVLTHASGAYPDAPGKLMPPLSFDDADVQEFLDKADDALAAAARSAGSTT